MQPYGFADSVDLLKRGLDRRRAGDVTGHPDRKEQRIETAFAHPGDVDAAAGVSRSDVKAPVGQEPLRSVVVGVDDDGARVERAGARRDLVDLARLRAENHRRSGEKQYCGSHWGLLNSGGLVHPSRLRTRTSAGACFGAASRIAII